MTKKKKEESKRFSVWRILILVLALAGGWWALNMYRTYFMPNIAAGGSYLYIRTDGNYTALLDSLEKHSLLKNMDAFKRAAAKMNLEKSLKPGRYRLNADMNNRTLINKIKSGNQDAVQLKIQNLRKKGNFAAYLAKNMEADSAAFMQVLDSAALLEKYGFNKENSYAMFIPNTYEVYWNSTPLAFFEKMQKAFDTFWTANRKQQAAAQQLNPIQATILASIVDAEALYDKEMPIIAGLYLNRLHRGILLQADPTVIFANNDFTVKRVTAALLGVNSPYNTYKNKGLPPGPIMMPSIHAIEAVLNPDKNNYLYMCAKEDFSGYHNFAATVSEHELNAKKYREALNKRKIYR